MRSTEVTDLRWPRWPNRQCTNSTLAMFWPNLVQILSFASMAPSQLLRETRLCCWSCLRLFLLWCHSSVTRPDPVNFFGQKLRKFCPHKVAQNPAALRAPFLRYPWKTSGGCTNPPVRARVNPHPAGVWLVTRPAGGGGAKAPPWDLPNYWADFQISNAIR